MATQSPEQVMAQQVRDTIEQEAELQRYGVASLRAFAQQRRWIHAFDRQEWIPSPVRATVWRVYWRVYLRLVWWSYYPVANPRTVWMASIVTAALVIWLVRRA